jgi:hypothetical protein
MESLTQARHHKLQQAVSFLPVVVQLLLFQPLIVVNVVLLARSATLLQTKNASFAGLTFSRSISTSGKTPDADWVWPLFTQEQECHKFIGPIDSRINNCTALSRIITLIFCFRYLALANFCTVFIMSNFNSLSAVVKNAKKAEGSNQFESSKQPSNQFRIKQTTAINDAHSFLMGFKEIFSAKIWTYYYWKIN